jgi:hypothetical protein
MASLQKKGDIALKYLHYALQCDIVYFQYLKTDSDLVFLQSDPDFIKFYDETELRNVEEVLKGVWMIAGMPDSIKFNIKRLFKVDNQFFFLNDESTDKHIIIKYRIDQIMSNKLTIYRVGRDSGELFGNPETFTIEKIQQNNR